MCISQATAALEAAVLEVENETVQEVKRSWQTLSDSLQGAKLDSLIMYVCIHAFISLLYWYVVCTCVCINHRAIINLEHICICVFVYICIYVCRLIATSAVIPIFKKLDTSPIVGFMLAGALLGSDCITFHSFTCYPTCSYNSELLFLILLPPPLSPSLQLMYSTYYYHHHY